MVCRFKPSFLVDGKRPKHSTSWRSICRMGMESPDNFTGYAKEDFMSDAEKESGAFAPVKRNLSNYRMGLRLVG